MEVWVNISGDNRWTSGWTDLETTDGHLGEYIWRQQSEIWVNISADNTPAWNCMTPLFVFILWLQFYIVSIHHSILWLFCSISALQCNKQMYINKSCSNISQVVIEENLNLSSSSHTVHMTPGTARVYVHQYYIVPFLVYCSFLSFFVLFLFLFFFSSFHFLRHAVHSVHQALAQRRCYRAYRQNTAVTTNQSSSVSAQLLAIQKILLQFIILYIVLYYIQLHCIKVEGLEAYLKPCQAKLGICHFK